eukprot:12445638-Prorocentrum_lima.AAC.1
MFISKGSAYCLQREPTSTTNEGSRFHSSDNSNITEQHCPGQITSRRPTIRWFSDQSEDITA